MSGLKQYLVLHEDSMFKQYAAGVLKGLRWRQAQAPAGLRTTELREFMAYCLQSPLSDGYDRYFWKYVSDRLQEHCDGIVLRSGRKIEGHLTAEEIVAYAFVHLRQSASIRVMTGNPSFYCVIYPMEAASHEHDTMQARFFDLPSRIQREVDALHELSKVTGI